MPNNDTPNDPDLADLEVVVVQSITNLPLLTLWGTTSPRVIDHLETLADLTALKERLEVLLGETIRTESDYNLAVTDDDAFTPENVTRLTAAVEACETSCRSRRSKSARQQICRDAVTQFHRVYASFLQEYADDTDNTDDTLSLSFDSSSSSYRYYAN